MQFDWTNFTYDSEWLREAVRIEEESGGEVGAGYAGLHLGKLMENPTDFVGMKRLQGIVTRELRDLLGELNLGVGTEAAFICARQIMLARLAEPEVSIQERLWAVLAEDERMQNTDPKPLRSGVKAIIREVMTEADWEAIASSASQSVHRHLIQQSQTLKVA